MRKNSPRKWLHACLDLLPVILIPVFMIYSHRHTIDNGTIDVPQNQVVDFNQQLQNGNFENSSYWLTINSNLVVNDGVGSLITVVDDVSSLEIYRSNLPYIVNHSYYITYSYNGSNVISSRFGGVGVDKEIQYSSYVFKSIQVASTGQNFFDVYFYGSFNEGDYVVLDNFMCIDLTQMFGEGNEPTLQQFSEWYPNDYYDYTLSHKELLKNTSTITYSDTDIMSQFTYQLYNSVDKYFNMGNVFNMTSVYDWFNLNIFGGNAPISIYIVWNIVLYEFVMDLLFLLYGLFMWFIDIVEHIMDKPFKSIK